MKSRTAIAVAVIAATFMLTGMPTGGWAQTKSAGDKPANNMEIVHEKLKAQLIVTDDDISGTFTFLRALPDYGNSPELTPQQITAVLNSHAPHLLHRHGVGPDSAAALLIAAGDNPERLCSEGSYAALCGASPVEASSGKTQRLRLNRGGDRQANAALYRITVSRLRWDSRTQDYLRRRLTEGKTRREAIRCLKRYIAREIFTLITPKAATALANQTANAA